MLLITFMSKFSNCQWVKCTDTFLLVFPINIDQWVRLYWTLGLNQPNVGRDVRGPRKDGN